jgi:hypothetical protein
MTSTAAAPLPARIAWFVGLAGHLAVLIWYLASGLLAPLWAVVGLLVIWVALLVVGVRLWRTRPAWMLAVPVVAAVIWFAVITAGESLLGWTA